MGLGTHSPGDPAQPVVPLKWEQFRRSLTNIVTALAEAPDAPDAAHHHVVVYVVVPLHFLTVTTGILHLRTILSIASGKSNLHSGAPLDTTRVLLHLVPETALLSQSQAHESPFSIARAVYDRLPRTVSRAASRPFFRRGLPWRARFDAPLVALARKTGAPRAELRYEWPARGLDVLDRGTLLHVGYAVSRCGMWVVLGSSDERGESRSCATWAWSAHLVEDSVAGEGESQGQGSQGTTMKSETESEMTPAVLTPAQLVKQVWKRAVEIAMQADVEWRLVITKHGEMPRDEIHGTFNSIMLRSNEFADLVSESLAHLYEHTSDSRPDEPPASTCLDHQRPCRPLAHHHFSSTGPATQHEDTDKPRSSDMGRTSHTLEHNHQRSLAVFRSQSARHCDSRRAAVDRTNTRVDLRRTGVESRRTGTHAAAAAHCSMRARRRRTFASDACAVVGDVEIGRSRGATAFRRGRREYAGTGSAGEREDGRWRGTKAREWENGDVAGTFGCGGAYADGVGDDGRGDRRIANLLMHCTRYMYHNLHMFL